MDWPAVRAVPVLPRSVILLGHKMAGWRSKSQLSTDGDAICACRHFEMDNGRHELNPRAISGILLAAFTLALAACSSSAPHVSPVTHADTITIRKTAIGPILVNSSGYTLYAFSLDKPDKSNCPTGACTALWPPLEYGGKPKLGPGLSSELLGKIRRPSGKYQVTYGSHPLYTYTVDTAPGQTHGEALEQFGGIWYALSPGGHEIKSR